MYVKFTKRELLELKQYWWTKYCNEVCVPEKDIFYALYLAYNNLLKFPHLTYKDNENL